MIYDGSNEPYALGGGGGGGGGGGTANLEWRVPVDPPAILAPVGSTFNIATENYLQRFSGNENIFSIDVSGTVTSNVLIGTSNSDYMIRLPNTYDTAAYSTGSRVGDLWLRTSSNNMFGSTFKAIAKIVANESNVMALRYVTGTADRPLTDVGAGFKIELQGSLMYKTAEFFTGSSLLNIIPTSIVQDTNGNVVINGGGFAPRAVLDVISTSNIPSFIVDLQTLSYSNTDIFQVRRNKVAKFSVNETGDMVVDGIIMNANREALWLPGAAAEWRDASIAPSWVLPTGAGFTYTSNVGKYRYFGHEIHNRFTINGTITSAPSNPLNDFTVTLPYPARSNLYLQETIVGDAWINVTVNGYLTTYKGYAKTIVGNANQVTIRYLNSIYDRSLGDFVAGSGLSIQADIQYQSDALGLVSLSTYKPAVMRQDMQGRIMVTNTEAFPVGRFHIYENSDDPAFIVQQQGLGDMFQFRSNASVPFVVDHSGNIGVGTTTPTMPLDIAGNMRITGAIYNNRNEAMWVPGSTLEWKAGATPSFILPIGSTFTASAANASFRYVGDEMLHNIYIQGVVGSTSGAGDYALQLAYPVKTSAYANPTIVGDLWLNVSSNVTSTTYKAYARTFASGADNMKVALRYLNVAYDLPLTSIAAGSTIQLQGTIAYQTPLIANNMPVPVVYKYADFVQDLGGNVIFSGDGYAPQGRFEVGQSSNAPAFIVNQRGTADIVQIKRTNDVRVVVDVNGNVGIGTTTPVGKLHVVGSLVLDGGNVGIGLTNPMSRLVVSGASTFQGNTTLGNDPTTNLHVIQGYVSHAYNGTQTALMVNQKSTGKIFELQDFSVPVLTVIDGGNVGIGLTNPMSKLVVSGASSFQGNTTLGNDPTTNLHVIQGYVSHAYNGTQTALMVNQKSTGKIFELQDFSVPVLTVIDGGNVGIGTIYPQSLLHVTGKVDLHQVGAGGGENRFKGLEAPTTANGRAQLVLSSAYSDLVIASSQASSSFGSTLTFAAYDPANSADYRKFVIQQRGWGGAQFMDFGYTNTATTNPHTVVSNGRLLTLDGDNQRVGIGIATPTYPLDVARAITSPSIYGVYMNYNGSGTWTGTWGVSGKFQEYVWATVGFVASSDARIKTNIQDIDDNAALSQLRLLKPRTYEYIDKVQRGSASVIGFIAQEVKEVIPRAVSNDKEIIPSIYELAMCMNGTIQLEKPHGLIENDTIQLIQETLGVIICKVKTVLSSTSFCVETHVVHDGKVFVFGKEIDDFNKLDKNQIFTIGVAATQELDREVQQLKSYVSALEQRILALENQT